MKILLVAGHGQGDSGASGGGYNEATTMRQLVNKIKNLIPNFVDVYNTNLDCYQQNGLATTGYKEVIEFHMDGAANTSAKGGHVIIYGNYSPDALDTRLKNAIQKHIGLWGGRPTGFSNRTDLQNLNVAANRGISYRLLELGFITNDNDRNKTIGQMDTLAILLAEAIQNKAINKPKPQPHISQGGPKTNKGLEYRVHIRNQGWLGYVKEKLMAGTTGKAIPIEALELFMDGRGDEFVTESHIQNIGWRKTGNTLGTTGQSKRLEAVRINRKGKLEKEYNIYYRVHVAGLGWQEWKYNGQMAGTTGQSRAIEAIEIKLMKK